MQAAWKVGAFVLVFVGLFAGILAVLNASLFAKPKDTYYARFTDAGGLNSGADVLLAGVSIGRVESVELAEDGAALATLSIDQGRKLPKNLVAVLPTSFIAIGDRQVLLKPLGTGTGFYAADNMDSPIPGQLQGPLDDILPDTGQTMEELNKTMVAFRELLQDKELKDGLVGVMKSGQDTAGKFGKLAEHLDGTLTRNDKRIDALLASMVDTVKNVESVTAELNSFAKSGKLQSQTEQLLATMNEAATEGKALVSDLRAYTADPEIQGNLKSTLENFNKMSESGVTIAANTEEITKNGIGISEQTKELMTKANKLADEVEKLIEDVKGAVKKFEGSGGASSLIPKIDVETGLTYNSEGSRLRADVNLQIPAGKDKLNLGLYDAFETNKLNIFFQRPLDQRTDLRYGVYASKPGIGVSYALAPNTWFQSELFGLNDPQLDIRLKRRFNESIFGWVGIDKVFGKNSLAVGVGTKR